MAPVVVVVMVAVVAVVVAVVAVAVVVTIVAVVYSFVTYIRSFLLLNGTSSFFCIVCNLHKIVSTCSKWYFFFLLHPAVLNPAGGSGAAEGSGF